MGRGAVVYANERRRQTPFHSPPPDATVAVFRARRWR